MRICFKRVLSLLIMRGNGKWKLILQLSFFSCDKGRIIESISWTNCTISSGSFSTANFSASIFDKSKILLMSSSKCLELRNIVFRCQASPVVFWLCNSCSVKPMIAVSGVRISWLILAKKRLFNWFACSAWAMATSSWLFMVSSALVRLSTLSSRWCLYSSSSSW